MPEAGPPPEPDAPLRFLCRVAVLALLVAAPLALGSVHEPSRRPFLAFAAGTGLLSWLAALRARARGAPTRAVPGRRLLIGFNLLVALQLVPLPPRVLYALSPSAFRMHRAQPGAVEGDWWPLSTSPPRTERGLPYLVALSLLYGAAYRELAGRRWRRRAAGAIVGCSFAMTLLGFVQRTSGEPNRIYGLWEPKGQIHVFGPYVNRSHYAGHAAIALPLVLALTVESLLEVVRLWRRRARGFTALGEPEASATALRAMVALFILAGLLSAGSRTGVVACAVSALAVPIGFGRRGLLALGLLAPLALASLLFADFEWFLRTFSREAFEAGRWVVWRDMAPIVRDFPFFGVGFNALGPAYRARYQTIYDWDLWDQAHNEYYQVLLDTGLIGATLALGLLGLLVRRALAAARRGAFGVGLLGALVANATSNMADFNLQIPANAATFVVVAALAVAYGEVPETAGGTPEAD